MLRGGLAWDGGKRKQSPKPSRCPALANFCHLKLNPSLAFLGPAARGTKLPAHAHQMAVALLPGMPDTERSSLRFAMKLAF